MARSLWTGSLSFGLVNVPVALVRRVRDLDLHFHQLHEKDGSPIELQRWCPRDEAEVPSRRSTDRTSSPADRLSLSSSSQTTLGARVDWK
jgi:hypothetical protein